MRFPEIVLNSKEFELVAQNLSQEQLLCLSIAMRSLLPSKIENASLTYSQDVPVLVRNEVFAKRPFTNATRTEELRYERKNPHQLVLPGTYDLTKLLEGFPVDTSYLQEASFAVYIPSGIPANWNWIYEKYPLVGTTFTNAKDQTWTVVFSRIVSSGTNAAGLVIVEMHKPGYPLSIAKSAQATIATVADEQRQQDLVNVGSR